MEVVQRSDRTVNANRYVKGKEGNIVGDPEKSIGNGHTDIDMNKYESAKTANAGNSERVLINCGLPTEGMAPHIEHFIVAKSDNYIIGSIGV
jgi:hypothetical protein